APSVKRHRPPLRGRMRGEWGLSVLHPNAARRVQPNRDSTDSFSRGTIFYGRIDSLTTMTACATACKRRVQAENTYRAACDSFRWPETKFLMRAAALRDAANDWRARGRAYGQSELGQRGNGRRRGARQLGDPRHRGNGR